MTWRCAGAPVPRQARKATRQDRIGTVRGATVAVVDMGWSRFFRRRLKEVGRLAAFLRSSMHGNAEVTKILRQWLLAFLIAIQSNLTPLQVVAALETPAFASVPNGSAEVSVPQ